MGRIEKPVSRPVEWRAARTATPSSRTERQGNEDVSDCSGKQAEKGGRQCVVPTTMHTAPTQMTLTPHDITIAITVYDRREFLEHAIESALNQTVPVKVMVVEDCGPDLAMRPFIESKYGSRIE